MIQLIHLLPYYLIPFNRAEIPTYIIVIARPSEARPWQSQSREIETCKSKPEVISKSLELNEITTSCALHPPRNDRETSSQINQ